MQGRNGGKGPWVSSTRREWMARAGAAAICGGALGANAAASALSKRGFRAADDVSGGGLSHHAEAIHQEATFKASPKRVYDALMDPAQFQKVELLSGAMKESELNAKPAEISQEAGGAFTLFGGYIQGRHIELVPAKRIVQAWRVGNWDPGVYSIVKFELVEVDGGTKIVFDQAGFPASDDQGLVTGWKAHYWDALTKYFA